MNRRSAYIAILGMVLFFLFGSCGEEGVGPECVNCEYWHRTSSGSARFPDVNPANWRLIAFSSRRDSLGGASKNYHIWVMDLGESPTDTTRFYQITKDDCNDLKPSWSSDGKWIAFQREVCGDNRYEIYAVDVSDLESPGPPVRVTRIDCSEGDPYSHTDPCWVTIGDAAYVVFTYCSVGNADHDILIAGFDSLGPQTPIPLTIDPSDYAAQEGGILSDVFHDVQTSSNRSNLVVFSSDSRTLVGDIRVEAYLADSTPVDAKIFIKGKDSEKTTPYVFRYRSVDQPIELTCELDTAYHYSGYCDPFDTTVTSLLADTLNVIKVGFSPTRGTLGVTQLIAELRYAVFVDGEEKIRWLAHGDTEYVTCLDPGSHIVELWFTAVQPPTLIDVDSNVVIEAGQVTEKVFRQSSQGSEINEVRFEGSHQYRPGILSGGLKSVSSPRECTIWSIDIGSVLSTDDDALRLIESSINPIQNPVITSDGDLVAYLVTYIGGSSPSQRIVVARIEEGGNIIRHTIGLPGDPGDLECWRLVESLSWLETDQGLKLIATLSPCGGGGVDDFEIWVADVEELLR